MTRLGKCPYCGAETELQYADIDVNDELSFFSRHGEPIITDSFYEIVESSKCNKCGEIFDFMVDKRSSLASKVLKEKELDKNK